ncbi:MAG: HigA family addiction module antitoxin [Ignavibacteria bacterium]
MTEDKIKYDPDTFTHPGETLSEKLSEMKIGPKEFAIRANKPEKTISEILSGNSSITPDMAIQFEKVLKIPARFWINSQNLYNEFVARKKADESISLSINWAKKFPLKQMCEYKWINEYKPLENATVNLLEFFGMANAQSWKQFYIDKKLKVSFRISLKNSTEPEAISAWLRKGELDAAKISVSGYNEKKLRDNIKFLYDLMYREPKDLYKQIVDVCSDSGVKFVLTETLTKAPINGATRWINDNPVIQLSCRYKWNDIFWFTFFHEIGHILLHGKKDFFLEDVNYVGKDKSKEDEANEFAVRNTLTYEQEDEILKESRISGAVIEKYSTKYKINPALIVGRLQRRGKIKHSDLNSYRKRFEIR